MATSRGLRLWLPKPKVSGPFLDHAMHTDDLADTCGFIKQTIQTFLGIMSLQTATEMILLALLINKVTGLYGLLAILTGYALDAIQLSMYIYSVVVLVALAFLLPHIRRQSPFQNLLLAWLYIFDTAANAAYTAFFAVEWYITSEGNPAGDAAEQATDTATSIVLIAAFTLIRVYLMFVVMSFTRQVMKRYVAGLASNHSDKATTVQPFARGNHAGEGWKGKLGRAMIFVGQDYWIGVKEDEEWASADPTRVPLAGAVDGDE